MKEGGRVVGGCRVGERAMAPILESYGHQRRDHVWTGVAQGSILNQGIELIICL
jgi:hypothetical protein